MFKILNKQKPEHIYVYLMCMTIELLIGIGSRNTNPNKPKWNETQEQIHDNNRIQVVLLAPEVAVGCSWQES